MDIINKIRLYDSHPHLGMIKMAYHKYHKKGYQDDIIVVGKLGEVVEIAINYTIKKPDGAGIKRRCRAVFHDLDIENEVQMNEKIKMLKGLIRKTKEVNGQKIQFNKSRYWLIFDNLPDKLCFLADEEEDGLILREIEICIDQERYPNIDTF